MVSQQDVVRLHLRYNSFVASHDDIVGLIRRCDRNSDGDLDVPELRDLLVVSIPRPTMLTMSQRGTAAGVRYC